MGNLVWIVASSSSESDLRTSAGCTKSTQIHQQQTSNQQQSLPKLFGTKKNWGKRGLSISKVGTFAPPKKMSSHYQIYYHWVLAFQVIPKRIWAHFKKLENSSSALSGQVLAKKHTKSGKRMVEELKLANVNARNILHLGLSQTCHVAPGAFPVNCLM